MPEPIDLRAAMNAISDVVQNRPRPLRDFDQIYMKTGDMVMQSELVADWADERRLAFIGDGDAISAGSGDFRFWATTPGETRTEIKTPALAHLVDTRRQAALSLNRVSTGIGANFACSDVGRSHQDQIVGGHPLSDV